MKQLTLQDKVLDAKLIKKHSVKECEEFEIALQHTSKWHIYKELKWEVGFEEYLQDLKGTPGLFSEFCSVTHGLFEELGRHATGGRSQECPNFGAYKESVEHVLFECTSYDSQRQLLWTTWSKFFFWMHLKFLFKVAFSIKQYFGREKQGMLVNNEFSSWCNKVGDFLLSVWRKAKFFYIVVDQKMGSVGPTPLQSARPMA